jgi:hypothetical protein
LESINLDRKNTAFFSSGDQIALIANNVAEANVGALEITNDVHFEEKIDQVRHSIFSHQRRPLVTNSHLVHANSGGV